MSLPRIALTLGDPAGVGPELAAKLLADPATAEVAEVVMIASPEELERAHQQAGLSPEPASMAVEPSARTGAAASDAGRTATEQGGPGRTTTVDPGRDLPLPTAVGRTSAEAGRWALDGLRCALRLAEAGEVDGICFTPLNKTSLHLAGMTEEDELRWFAGTLGHAGRTSEFNVLDRLWTARVTSHIALAQVPALITADAVAETVGLLHTALADAGTPTPRIAVAALNPHAGENGHFGRQEIDQITPGIERAQADGIDVRGPFPSDTIFLKARAGEYDGVVTMYHDQGQIAMKLLGFDRGVTVQGGLPIPITTPAHGTAFDIAGTRSADVGATRNAFRLCARLAAHRRS